MVCDSVPQAGSSPWICLGRPMLVDNIEPLMYNSADPQHRVAVNWKAFGVGRGAPALIPDRR
jgi:hypothetical protein